MDSDTLDRIRLAIDGDANLDEQMAAPPWVSIDGNVETPDGSVAWATHDDTAEMDPWNAAGIARARNRWALYLELARAAVAKRAFVPEIDYSNIREGLAIDEEYDAALAALAPEGAT